LGAKRCPKVRRKQTIHVLSRRAYFSEVSQQFLEKQPLYGPKFGFSLHIDEQAKGGVVQKQCLLYHKSGAMQAFSKQRICEVGFKNQL
jgi:hypothetical protein